MTAVQNRIDPPRAGRADDGMVNRAPRASLDPPGDVVRFRGVRKTYDGRRLVVDDLDLRHPARRSS